MRFSRRWGVERLEEEEEEEEDDADADADVAEAEDDDELVGDVEQRWRGVVGRG